LPEVSTYVRIVTDVIERKDQNVATYERKLSHVNLIILDHGNRPITVSPRRAMSSTWQKDGATLQGWRMSLGP
jgi:hypothetical protein